MQSPNSNSTDNSNDTLEYIYHGDFHGRLKECVTTSTGYKRPRESHVVTINPLTLITSENTSSLISHQMAGASPSLNPHAGHIGVHLVLGSLMLAASAIPLPTARLSPHNSSLTATKLLEWTVDYSFPIDTSGTLTSEVYNVTKSPMLTEMQCSSLLSFWKPLKNHYLTSQLRQTEFYPFVCPMFLNYTRFNVTLEHTSESSTSYAKLSLITFLLKKSMELTCEKVGNSNPFLISCNY